VTPVEMAAEAASALAAGQRMLLVRPRGVRMPPKFPRGELLCEQDDGNRCYSYDPLRVLAWLAAMGLVTIERTVAQSPDATPPQGQ